MRFRALELHLEDLKNKYSRVDEEYEIIEEIEFLLNKELGFKPDPNKLFKHKTKNVYFSNCKCGNIVFNTDKRCSRCNTKLIWSDVK